MLTAVILAVEYAQKWAWHTGERMCPLEFSLPISPTDMPVEVKISAFYRHKSIRCHVLTLKKRKATFSLQVETQDFVLLQGSEKIIQIYFREIHDIVSYLTSSL